MKRNISTVVHKELFFTRYHYEICAKIELVFEKSDRFFLESGLEKDEELVKKVSDRINNFLGMTSEPWDWKRRRLVLSKLKMTMNCQETVDEETRKELAVKSWDVLHRARMALDDCISEFFQVKKSIYPHAYNKMTEKERKMLLKKAGSRENYEKQREPYLTKRLKEEWLPQNGETKLKYEVIEGLLREAFGAFKGKKVPEDVLKFVARREHHIITKEAAWHVAWIENDNLYKHNITAWHLGKVEEQLNEYRDITGLFNGEHVTAYDAAHWAAEFAERNISTVVHKELFFTRYHYEICAKIELVFEKSDRFFLESGLEKDEELVKKVSDRINNFLGMTSEPWDWKRRRLVLSKLKMTMNCQETVDEETRKELAVKSWDVLHRARMALDDCISEFFQVKKSIYPHAYNKMTEKERKMLLKKAGSRENYEKQREPYLTKRLKEEWLPQNGETKLKYEVIEGLLREAFGAFKGKKVPEDVLKFVARREHHIITKEAAWHVAWVENDNLYKHNITAWHLGKVEEQLNEYRDITGLFNGEHVTAYDAAHWAAEFAEQTCIISKHNSNTMRRNSSDF